jgi:hypothetical protein
MPSTGVRMVVWRRWDVWTTTFANAESPTKKAAANDGFQRLEHLLGLARRHRIDPIGAVARSALAAAPTSARLPGDIEPRRKLHLRHESISEAGFLVHFDST